MIENGILGVKDSWWQQKSLGTSALRVRALRKHLRVKLLKNMHLIMHLSVYVTKCFKKLLVEIFCRLSVENIYFIFILYFIK